MTSKNQLRGSHLLYQITRTNKETKMSFRVESVWVNSKRETGSPGEKLSHLRFTEVVMVWIWVTCWVSIFNEEGNVKQGLEIEGITENCHPLALLLKSKRLSLGDVPKQFLEI